MLRPKIGLDWDDVTAPFNSIAIDMANETYKFDPPLSLEEITSWENTGRASVVKEFYMTEELYQRQAVPEKTKKAVRKLMEIADVYFITAVYPQFMGVRAKQILEAFPELPQGNIILGNAKNLVQFDIILDDAIHNVLESPAAYPVLMRKPWNWKMTGLLSVNHMSEFVHLVRQIMNVSMHRKAEIKTPSVLALVGPSGSGKTQIAETLCETEDFLSPKTYCTKQSDKHKYLNEEAFSYRNFFEKTRYAGVWYGTKKEDIQSVLDVGKFAVMPLDMCGAIVMKRHFPTVIIYVHKEKEALIRDIIEETYSTEEKTLRLLSLDAEKRNSRICDYVVDNTKSEGAVQLLEILGKKDFSVFKT
uniref:5' nucleotidase, NT5C type n=1 Tax=Agathobacter sp. TaxID=2021311 RepID=UPI0040567F0B